MASQDNISIHALRKESDSCCSQSKINAQISIHALRKESDGLGRDVRGGCNISIHALRKESDQHHSGAIEFAVAISIHALRKESDKPHRPRPTVRRQDFNPRSP